MASTEHKVQVLRKFVTTFTKWLDTCDQVLLGIPSSSQLETSNTTSLRELALSFKVRRCTCVHDVYMHACVLVRVHVHVCVSLFLIQSILLLMSFLFDD